MSSVAWILLVVLGTLGALTWIGGVMGAVDKWNDFDDGAP